MEVNYGMTDFETINFETTDGVATVTLNRPDAYNALNQTLLEELYRAFQHIADDPGLRAVVLTGAGRAFCSGQDLRDFQAGDVADPGAMVREALEHRYSPLIKAMHALPKPIIAAVNGVAAGAGMSLALAADLRLASDRAFFTLAFNRIALVPDAGSNYALPRMVGLSRALELAWTSRRVDAEEALRIGLVNRVVPDEDLAGETKALAQELARGPALAFALTKQAMTTGIDAPLPQVMTLEAELQAQCVVSDDFREGITAFMEKREPHFSRSAAGATSPES